MADHTQTLVGHPEGFVASNNEIGSGLMSQNSSRSASPDTAENTNLEASMEARQSPNEPARRIRLVPIRNHGHQGPITAEDRPVERKIDVAGGTVRVGRSADLGRAQEGDPMPILYKSKVVSRSHAELGLNDAGMWFVCDVGSSSGTFVNGRRLSDPGKRSQRHPLRHGDELQVGVNFRGGSQQQFRCVKLRVELDAAAGLQPSGYNVESFHRLKGAFAGAPGDGLPGPALQDCCICLHPLRPGEPLFIAPCAHGWHYRCIRPVLVQAYPLFGCPNCRRTFDVEEDVDDISS